MILLAVIFTTGAIWKLLDSDRFLSNGVLPKTMAAAGGLTAAAVACQRLRACAPVAMTILAVKSTAETALTVAFCSGRKSAP